MPNYLPHLFLASLTLLGYLGLHHLGNLNGLFPLLEQLGKTYPIPTSNEGLKNLGGILVGFFLPSVDGSHPGLTLACYVFVGQANAMWQTIMLEGHRHGNRMRAVYFTTLCGVTFQLVGGAVVLPAWFLLHLLTSPTVTTPTKRTLNIEPATLLATPVAILLGSVLPTILMSLPSPSLLTYQQRINFILLWQAFPIWTNLAQLILPYLPFFPDPSKTTSTTLLRTTYLPTITFSALFHVSGLTLALTPLLAPALFTAPAATQFPAALFSFPPQPFSDAKISSAAEGALWFIQYDYAICSFAFLAWAFVLRGAVGRGGGGGGGGGATGNSKGLAGRLLETAAKAAVLGPMAAGALLVWERDLAVEEGEGADGRKKHV